MDETVYRYMVLLLLSYVLVFLLVLSIEFLSISGILAALILGSILGFGLLRVLD